MKKEFTVVPDGPFSLEAAASFGFGPNTGRPQPEGGLMRLAFVADDMTHQAGAVVRQDGDGTLTITVEGPDGLDAEAALHQVTRILSLDVSVAEWLAAGQRDPVLSRIQAEHAGLRPVLFHSPYEAAAWSVLSARRHRSQGIALRQRLAEAHGRAFELAGEASWALPAPEQLLTVTELPGAEPARLDRLHGVARAALDGQLDPARLLALEPAEALRDLRTIPGIGPVYATLILLRSTGATDILTLQEPRLPFYLAHFYDLPEHRPATAAQIAAIAEPWKPFRTWGCVLVRVAGDRAGLPWR